jgi:hypothetical protein
MTKHTQRLAVLIACGAAAPLASAQLTHYVPFNFGYAVDADLNGQGGFDLGFGANFWFDGAAPGEGSTIVEGNLGGAPGLDRMGNHATTPGPFNTAFYTFDLNNNQANGEPEDRLAPGVHWVSFIARTSTEADFGGLSFVKFFGPEILYMGKVGGNGGTEWGMDPGGNAQAAGGNVNNDTFIAVRLTIGPDANDDTAEMFINPRVGSTAPATPDLSISFNEDPNDNRGIDEIRIGGQNGPFAVDEIRIGASYADVAPGTPPMNCNAADLAAPFGSLTFADITAFLDAFSNSNPAADLADPIGSFTFADITAFLAAFSAGCP